MSAPISVSDFSSLSSLLSSEDTSQSHDCAAVLTALESFAHRHATTMIFCPDPSNQTVILAKNQLVESLSNALMSGVQSSASTVASKSVHSCWARPGGKTQCAALDVMRILCREVTGCSLLLSEQSASGLWFPYCCSSSLAKCRGNALRSLSNLLLASQSGLLVASLHKVGLYTSILAVDFAKPAIHFSDSEPATTSPSSSMISLDELWMLSRILFLSCLDPLTVVALRSQPYTLPNLSLQSHSMSLAFKQRQNDTLLQKALTELWKVAFQFTHGSSNADMANNSSSSSSSQSKSDIVKDGEKNLSRLFGDDITLILSLLSSKLSSLQVVPSLELLNLATSGSELLLNIPPEHVISLLEQHPGSELTIINVARQLLARTADSQDETGATDSVAVLLLLTTIAALSSSTSKRIRSSLQKAILLPSDALGPVSMEGPPQPSSEVPRSQWPLRALLCDFMTAVNSSLATVVPDLMFQLCEREPDAFVAQVGVGRAAGYMQGKGMLGDALLKASANQVAQGGHQQHNGPITDSDEQEWQEMLEKIERFQALQKPPPKK